MVRSCPQLLYCLRFYRGDEKIKGFVFDLITPSENGEPKVSKNHMGLSAPVPRGRNSKMKKLCKKDPRDPRAGPEEAGQSQDWSQQEKYDGDIFLENNYKKHLCRHANK